MMAFFEIHRFGGRLEHAAKGVGRMTDEDDKRKAAIRRLMAKRGFWNHAVTYLVVNALLVAIWEVTGPRYFWPIWVMGGWGIGLILHAWNVFFVRPVSEDEIRREMERSGPYDSTGNR
jgi:hypothetical protein